MVSSRQLTTCSVCGNTGASTESNLIFPISVTNSIQMSLDKFFDPISLSGENSYQCDNCGCRQDAEQISCVTQNPKYIFFQIKRYKFIQGRRFKDRSNVHLNKSINLTVTNNGHQQIQSYKLIGTIHHSGEDDKGHYFSYVYVDNQWNKCDDRYTCKIGYSQIPNENSYLVIYKSDT